MALNRKKAEDYTGMILEVIIQWPFISRLLEEEGNKNKEQFVDSKGKYVFTVTLLIEILKIRYQDLLKKRHNTKSNVPYGKIKNNASSLFVQIFRVLELLGLACKSPEQIGPKRAHIYEFKCEIHNLNLAQLHFLFQEGRRLKKRIAKGELAGDEGKREHENVEFTNKKKKTKHETQIITVPLNGNVEIKEIKTIITGKELKIYLKY